MDEKGQRRGRCAHKKSRGLQSQQRLTIGFQDGIFLDRRHSLLVEKGGAREDAQTRNQEAVRNSDWPSACSTAFLLTMNYGKWGPTGARQM